MVLVTLSLVDEGGDSMGSKKLLWFLGLFLERSLLSVVGSSQKKEQNILHGMWEEENFRLCPSPQTYSSQAPGSGFSFFRLSDRKKIFFSRYQLEFEQSEKAIGFNQRPYSVSCPRQRSKSVAFTN